MHTVREGQARCRQDPATAGRTDGGFCLVRCDVVSGALGDAGDVEVADRKGVLDLGGAK